MDEILKRLAIQFQTLRCRLAAVDHGGNAAGATKFLGSTATAQRPRKGD